VNPRRGWFVVQPSPEAAREAFAARQVIETGLLQSLPRQLDAAAIKRLKQHVAQEKAAVAAADAGQRSFLLGDFHVCLAECAGNSTLADILRDLTARTTLIATLYQSSHEAEVSCHEHAQIVAALARGDNHEAIALMRQHIDNVSAHLSPAAAADPLASLRAALSPLAKQDANRAQGLHTTTPSKQPARRRLFTSLVTPPVPPHPEKRR
jgi:DNA-binding GntR family transcriptional regulator